MLLHSCLKTTFLKVFFLEYARASRIICIKKEESLNYKWPTSAQQQKLKGDYIGVKNYLRTQFVAVFYPAPGVAKLESPEAPAFAQRPASALMAKMRSTGATAAALKQRAFRCFHTSHDTSAKRKSIPERCTPFQSARSRRHQEMMD